MKVIVNIQGEDSQLGSSQPIPLATWEDWFQTWLNDLETELPEAEAYELSLRLTDDQEITQFNSQYRQQNNPTDVLAFAALEADIPWSEELNSEPLYLGDLIISLETAARQAQTKGHSLKLELAWLASHGCLHLLGWDHPDEASLELMLDQQENLLKLVDLSFDLLK
ncbi:MAG: rRNA maturation RNase YbeY [Gloeocapsa sp. DLM2.Bin57]|nr:MAG: rRNA maturation RNase YbeY [Gloeocapsa sp. DLM2.Bin57]